MKLELDRINVTEKETVGALYVDGELQCFTMEDPVRDKKIKGKTAIPEGTYKIVLRWEGGMIERYKNKFGHMRHPAMLWLVDVPNFEYVYLHIGNTVHDTEGCILVGSLYDVRNPATVAVSTAAYLKLYEKVLAAINREEAVEITIRGRGE